MKTQLRFLMFALAAQMSCQADLLVDSFVTSQNASGGTLVANTADGSGILGGEREFNTILTISVNGLVPGQLYLAYPSGPTGLVGGDITYAGVDHDPHGDSFGGLGSVDLSVGGLYDRFRLEITSAHSSGSSLRVDIRQYGMGSYCMVDLPQHTGLFDIPFSLFNQDPTFGSAASVRDVGYLNFEFVMTSGDAIAIDSIVTSAVPEPSATYLFLFACALLIRRTTAVS